MISPPNLSQPLQVQTCQQRGGACARELGRRAAALTGAARARQALERYQKHFVWDLAGEGGVYGLVEKELVLRAQLLREMAPVARRSLAAHSRRRSLAAPGRRHSRDLLGQPERWDV